MKSVLKEIIRQNQETENQERQKMEAELRHPSTRDDRRNFLKKSLAGGITLAGFMSMKVEDTMAQATSKVNRASKPSELKITDMRYCIVQNVGRTPIIRIDTNQGIYGLGEVRDGADERYALMLKSRILGQNPCNVEQLFKVIKQFGHHARQGGGVSGVEMALWDLCGKAYGVPCWQLLGGRYRDKIRLYADTPEFSDLDTFKERIHYRTVTQGYSWLKMDVSIGLLRNMKDGLVNNEFWGGAYSQWGGDWHSYANTRHPFTQVQITEKGLEYMAGVVESVRNVVGYQIPISTDHYGYFDLNNNIRLGRALEKFRLAWLEDMVPWDYVDQWRKITEALETPTLTGEDIYLKEGFKPLIDTHAVDIVHPDLASAGGLLETKKIGDYAEENGIAMALHFAGTPVSFMANVHCAAATQNFLSLELHSVDVDWWEDLVITTDGRKLIEKGYANVPLEAPGLGIELNDEVVKQHLHPNDKSYFAPTTEWDDKRSHDRLWS